MASGRRARRVTSRAGGLGRLLLLAVATVGAASRALASDAACRAAVRVSNARATYRMPLVGGQPTARDASIEVELTSTGTAAIGTTELAIFLGASLEAIARTRAAALPTARPRALEDGGLAFRAEAPAVIAPGETRTVTVEKRDLPLEGDLSSVTVLVIGCRALHEVGDIALHVGPPARRGLEGELAAIAAVAAGSIVLVMLVRLLR